MKIVIGGAGAVGTHLAKLFSLEHHDITVIDNRPHHLAELSDHYDLLTLVGNPTSISVLHNSRIHKADLFVGVTPNETDNITACMLARNMGAKQTIARVNSDEYLQPANQELFKSVGIDFMIIPEVIAGSEIAASVSRSWIRQLWEVENSDLVMLGIKVREGSRILHVPLKDICGPDDPYHIVAIKRQNETLVPRGNDMILPLDLVYFMTTRKYIPYIREVTDKEDYPDVKNVTFMGGSPTTVYAVKSLAPNTKATIIEKDPDRCDELAQIFKNHVKIIQQDGRYARIYRDEDLQKCDAFVSLTNETEINILSCLAAKHAGVRKTVAMIGNMHYINMAQSLDIGTLVNKQNIAAAYIYQRILKADVANVKSLMVANADVAEFIVKAGAKITRGPVRTLRLPEGTDLGGMVRNGQSMLINGNTQFREGDRVVVFCVGNDLNKLSAYF